MADPDDFGYEKFARKEFGNPAQLASRRWFWRMAAVGIVIVIVAATVFVFFLR
jgi:anti-sigma-K factor RskA